MRSAFKFLPLLGRYVVDSMHRSLPAHLADKWKFRGRQQSASDTWEGDGSRGGPARRELSPVEEMQVASRPNAKL